MQHLLSGPWPWYVVGPIIGLVVPLLLILDNRHFGISANLRHICAACFPAGIPFFSYNWRKEMWNLFFIGGAFIGGLIAAFLLANPDPISVNPNLVTELSQYNIHDLYHYLPQDIFTFAGLLTGRGFLIMILGGFLVGFGTRYAGGCTSGHSIMGLSMLQWPSLVATICFMAGGFLMANLILPLILTL
jgi:uncharacterized membrane protein YedE/YeeE